MQAAVGSSLRRRVTARRSCDCNLVSITARTAPVSYDLNMSSRRRGTKIVATLGPASASAEVIRALVDAGMDVVRLNFSHGDHQSHAAIIDVVRQVQSESGKPLAIIGDLQGPKLRIGPLATPLDLHEGDVVRLAAGSADGGNGLVLTAPYPSLPGAVRTGAAIYLRDGEVELRVESVSGATITTTVLRGGTVTSRAGLTLRGGSIDLPALTEQDLDDLRFCAERDIDYVALSFVRRPEDVHAARAELTSLGVDTPIIAKIETALALRQLDEIVAVSDGVMVARGDLGVEVGPEEVPVWQRRIIEAAARQLVPVIVATQMLESMTTHSRPTRAEASDVANAVREGADALMLSAESAVGAHPVESVAMMERIIQHTEASEPDRGPHDDGARVIDAPHSISRAVREIALHDRSVRGVVVFTHSGYSARLIAKGQVPVDVLTLTPSVRVQQRLALTWGSRAIVCSQVGTERDLLREVSAHASEQLGCADGDTIIVVNSMPVGGGGETNSLTLHRLGSAVDQRA